MPFGPQWEYNAKLMSTLLKIGCANAIATRVWQITGDINHLD